jgi:hypothetical protein
MFPHFSREVQDAIQSKQVDQMAKAIEQISGQLIGLAAILKAAKISVSDDEVTRAISEISNGSLSPRQAAVAKSVASLFLQK